MSQESTQPEQVSSLDTLVETTENIPAATLAPETQVVDEPKATEAPAVKAEEYEPLKPQNVFVSLSPFIETKGGEFQPGKPFLVLPASFPSEVLQVLESMPNVQLGDTEKTSDWFTTMNDGFNQGVMAQANRAMKTLSDPNAHFVQKVTSQVGDLYGKTPTFPAVKNETLQGEKALLRFMNYTGLGTIFKFPLWHSGIWITLKAPSEGRLLELHREMIADRLSVGRQTHGLSFANTAAYHNESLFNMAIEHIYQISVSTDKPLRDLISVHDIPTLIWGMAVTIWNPGYQYRRACTHAPDKCNHVAEGKIDLKNLSYGNTNNLTDWQVKHMTSHAQNSMRIEDIERYQQESINSQKKKIELKGENGSEYTMLLKIPKAGEYFDMAHRWLGEIVRSIELAISSDATSAEKEAAITNACKSSMMRQFGHWVDSIDFQENTIADRDTLEIILDRLSADDGARDEFSKKVNEYIDTSMLTVFGIPTYDCPQCKRSQHIEGAKEGASSVIPIDMAATFFILLVQRLQQITLR